MTQKGKGIKLSPKYGVNPSVTHCECCGKEIGIAMFGKLKGDVEAPKDVFMGLCDDCQKVIDAEGLMIIEVKDGETGKNPYRTGRLVGITKDAKERMFKDINSPICYMEQSMFNKIFGEAAFKQ
jgi:hypothetical protein